MLAVKRMTANIKPYSAQTPHGSRKRARRAVALANGFRRWSKTFIFRDKPMKTLVTRLLIVAIAASALSGCIIIDRSGEHFTQSR